ncbi:GNAT family N-acetyltransferase [Mucilaginibacter rubeus]|uniref:GNAT family N-acetyltransferase n=2 Tax=Mucilaginibacter rubeus TaxID=2027860 RepID=A0AAE6MGS5_9SPHI|nr:MULTISPECIES: GNAT family N-acetyltransferase [Mucilaginibacter]QEM02524.1 GNAT family N-acetyltransferase [Mucilaginibacter rubeus]QEM15144.1 GNAT family N-acetyltransferase [Mucilaginibacter gossypii]QTE42133.1 GNAT family N-acetyltransferase [Mucilaginibacter rubeus]QTE48734.1 GNAT family N-acetyltransferase [Mucilaginibacter rubeus]QTE53832.1 GNAT family N-acetyltransferase [Mucilaginibacter rubeus]
MEIISITDHHLSHCAAILVDAYNASPWNCLWTSEKAYQYLAELVANRDFVGFVVYDNDEPAGAVLGHKKTWWTNRQLMIDELFVSPAFQKKGYGKKLMQHCEDYAAVNDIELLVLMTNKFLPVYNFYEMMDYTLADQYVFMFKQLNL